MSHPTTHQQVFDMVAVHLLTQNAKSVVPVRGGIHGGHYDSCRYRAPSGKQCAVGILIPDDAYHPQMEGMGVLTIFAWDGMGWMRPFEALLVDLQTIHDRTEPVVWREQLRDVAKSHGLDPSILDLPKPLPARKPRVSHGAILDAVV